MCDIDYYKPRNPNIPYFPSTRAYHRHPKPQVDGIVLEDCRTWLVQPGLHAVEVYEAIIRAVLGYSKTLKIWICQVGLGLHMLPRRSYADHWRNRTPEYDYGACEDRDVCFVLLTPEESGAVYSWMSKHKYNFGPTNIMTPLESVFMLHLIFDENVDEEELLQNFLQQLGLQDQALTRTVLPPYVRQIPPLPKHWPWRLPGNDPPLPDLQTRAAADLEGIQRIYWIWPPPYKLAVTK